MVGWFSAVVLWRCSLVILVGSLITFVGLGFLLSGLQVVAVVLGFFCWFSVWLL